MNKMDQQYRKVKRTAVFTAVLCVLIVIGMYVMLILPWLIPAKPPSIRKIERTFSMNQESFCTIVDFLAQNKAHSIHITEDNGRMKADFVELTIQDEAVRKAISQLFSRNPNMKIFKNGYTIEFFWWSHWIVDIGSYIAYSTDVDRIPLVQFATEVMPMKASGWYYIISDYNKWRIEN